MAIYRKKPVIVEAIQVTVNDWAHVLDFAPEFKPQLSDGGKWPFLRNPIDTVTAELGDWLVKEGGTIIVFSADSFAANYEPGKKPRKPRTVRLEEARVLTSPIAPAKPGKKHAAARERKS